MTEKLHLFDDSHTKPENPKLLSKNLLSHSTSSGAAPFRQSCVNHSWMALYPYPPTSRHQHVQYAIDSHPIVIGSGPTSMSWTWEGRHD